MSIHLEFCCKHSILKFKNGFEHLLLQIDVDSNEEYFPYKIFSKNSEGCLFFGRYSNSGIRKKEYTYEDDAFDIIKIKEIDPYDLSKTKQLSCENGFELRQTQIIPSWDGDQAAAHSTKFVGRCAVTFDIDSSNENEIHNLVIYGL